MIATNLITTNYRLDNLFRLIDDIDNNNYYFFVGDYLPQQNTTIQPLYDNTSNTLTQCYRNMIMGVALSANNVYPVINNNQWQANTVYSRYDDMDANLSNENFFVITTEGSYHHIWKVLDNQFNSPSLIQPLFAHSANTPFFQTSDGYVWKYLTTVQDSIALQFQTSEYFPVIANSTVEQAAVPGELKVFDLLSNGSGYHNYVSGTFTSADIFINGDLTLFNISNNEASSVNGYYTGCLLYISGGPAQGQYATVVDYVANSTGNIIKLATALIPSPQNSSVFQINPQVLVVGDGLQTVNCVARALINSNASNSVYSVESLNFGQNYVSVSDVEVISNSVVGVTNTAMIRAILPPLGGHGANVFSELYCNSVGLSIELANTQSNTILATNDYQQIGIMKNPQFANVNLVLSGINGLYLTGEQICAYTSQQIDSNVTVMSSSANISCNNANFINQFQANDSFIIISGDGAKSQLVQVANVVNSSFLTISTNAMFSCTECVICDVMFNGNATVTSGGGNNIIVSNCSPNFTISSSIIGAQSGTTATINNVLINGVQKDFQTFVELYKYNATVLSGTFIQNEQVIQGNNTASLFAVEGSSNSVAIYLSNFEGGTIDLGNITGANSGATANITGKYVPDIIYGSGEILYIENISAVTRANDQSENFQLILNF